MKKLRLLPSEPTVNVIAESETTIMYVFMWCNMKYTALLMQYCWEGTKNQTRY